MSGTETAFGIHTRFVLQQMLALAYLPPTLLHSLKFFRMRSSNSVLSPDIVAEAQVLTLTLKESVSKLTSMYSRAWLAKYVVFSFERKSKG